MCIRDSDGSGFTGGENRDLPLRYAGFVEKPDDRFCSPIAQQQIVAFRSLGGGVALDGQLFLWMAVQPFAQPLQLSLIHI